MADPCADVLVPNFTMVNASSSATYAYLSLITQQNYNQEKQKIAASADIPIADLVLGGNATYQQFETNLQNYFNQNQISMTSATAVAIVRQTVDDAARQDFVTCMEGATGLRVWFADETPTDAAVYIAYTGQPGAGPLTYQVQLLGGTATDATEINGMHSLPSGGKTVILVTRSHPQGEMRVSVNGGGYASEAVSIVPLPPPVVPPAPPPPAAHNIAGGAAVQMSPTGVGTVANGGYWNAKQGAPPTASVSFTWPNAVTITQITLIVVQTPSGTTHHQIFGIHTDGTQVLMGDLVGVTNDGQTLLQTLQPPVGPLQAIRIDTLSSPSWVAWRSIQIFGY